MSDEPDTAEGEGLEAAIGFVDVVCARAATVGKTCRRYGADGEDDDGAVLWRRYLLSLAAPLSDRIKVWMSVESSAQVNLVIRAAGPSPLFIAQGDRGPPAIVGWAPPIRARGSRGPSWAVGPNSGLRSF